jgi:polysaccharide biosynthesis protein PslG
VSTPQRVAATLAALVVAGAVTYVGGTVASHTDLRTVPTAISDAQLHSQHVGGVALGSGEPANPRRRADYAAMREMNASWVRSDIDWRAVEEAPGQWNFSRYDPVVDDANAEGLRHLAILHTVPAWANGGAGVYASPEDLELLSEYCRQTALHYIPRGVLDYEVGNEVNLPHPGWDPTGPAYVEQLLRPCTTGVRSAAQELGAEVNVILGSVVPGGDGPADPVRFLTEVYESGGGSLFDNVSVHPYTRPLAPTASDHLTAFVDRIYQVMQDHGDAGKKIWATEYGYPTAGPHSTSEELLATYVDAAVDLWYSHPFAGPLFWYSARDTGTDQEDAEQNFGLLRHDGEAKATYAELATRFTRQ